MVAEGVLGQAVGAAVSHGPPRLFDRPRLRARRERAAAADGSDAFFLEREAAVRLVERLDDVRRRFSRILALGTDPLLVEDLRRREARAFVVHADPAAARLSPYAHARLAVDEAWLPFAPASFDLVLAGPTLTLVDDLPGVLVQIRRVLVPDGLMLAALFGGATLAELRTALVEAELAETGGAGVRVAPFADLADAAALLQRAGFALPVADREVLTVRYADPWRLLVDLRAAGLTGVLMERAPLRRAVLARAVQRYRELFADADGRVRATFELFVLTGWAPHPSQPRPKARGSGQIDLAALLGRPPGGVWDGGGGR